MVFLISTWFHKLNISIYTFTIKLFTQHQSPSQILQYLAKYIIHVCRNKAVHTEKKNPKMETRLSCQKHPCTPGPQYQVFVLHEDACVTCYFICSLFIQLKRYTSMIYRALLTT